MRLFVMTLFPEMVENTLHTSITGRAIDEGLIELNCVNIRDFSKDKHRKVDDYPFGGGAGMVMEAQPVYDCYRYIHEKTGRDCPVIAMSPKGRTFNQGIAKDLSKESDLIFLCGHYEGIDQRVLDEIVTDYISIGDFVLTGGELAACVICDCVARLVPGVLGNGESAETESFENNLLEYPQYTRPEEWRGRKVPDILLSGNHRLVDEWRLEQSIERTRTLRPDLFKKALPGLRDSLSNRLKKKFLKKNEICDSIS
ncbi:MAG: tRNA (guanosine(37)-N1)-methyltransferase TrmD [Lachnospiraceae bacterium]|uniref:tRNA (guanine-N(1)-)-methyltransferase n=1 Tax=Candidatus Weimeria bifida TaxID=2599074 RepID=A0A6N7IWD7_9FIRM|nr:tRNA (guanosine(37)-N1)-methyltransferase TrmD [Candidatus Weimeria bifida]RRF96112.1 MAG: tRNA (guanosine(37)-N1)-methyltransferase TrmD [Lachnospiraceae bacterium]